MFSFASSGFYLQVLPVFIFVIRLCQGAAYHFQPGDLGKCCVPKKKKWRTAALVDCDSTKYAASEIHRVCSWRSVKSTSRDLSSCTDYPTDYNPTVYETFQCCNGREAGCAGLRVGSDCRDYNDGERYWEEGVIMYTGGKCGWKKYEGTSTRFKGCPRLTCQGATEKGRTGTCATHTIMRSSDRTRRKHLHKICTLSNLAHLHCMYQCIFASICTHYSAGVSDILGLFGTRPYSFHWGNISGMGAL